MKKTKFWKALLLSALTVTFLALGVACGDKSTSEKQFTGFQDGVAVKVRRGELITLEEFIVYVTDSEYSITLSKEGSDKVEDLTNGTRWAANKPGTYTFTYTIFDGEYKGTYTHTFVVPADGISWSCSLNPITVMYDKELLFEDIYKKLNIYVNSYYPWEPFVESVYVNGQLIEIDANATSYYVKDLAAHDVIFGVRTTDGQKMKSIVKLNVVYSEHTENLYLHENTAGSYAMEVQGATSVKVNGNVCADATITGDSVSFDYQTLYQKYPGINFVSVQTASGEVRDTINVYTESVSMEGDNAMPPIFLSAHGGDLNNPDGRLSISNKFATHGENSVEVLTSTYLWPRMLIHMDYLDYIFEDPNVDRFAFDITYVGSTPEHAYREYLLSGYGSHSNGSSKIYRNEPKTITMSRVQYETLKADIAQSIIDAENDSSKTPLQNAWKMTLMNTRDAVGGYDAPARLYFDNFRAVYALPTQTIGEGDTESAYQVELAGVTKVTFNGQAIPADKVQITATDVSIDQAWLCTHGGENVLKLYIGAKEYEQKICIYKNSYNFDDDNDPKVIFPTDGSAVIETYNDSKALKMSVKNGSYIPFRLSAEYLAWAFANKAVQSLSFDLTIVCDAIEDNNKVILTKDLAGTRSYQAFTIGETGTVTITRAQYQAFAAADPATNAKAGICEFRWDNSALASRALTWYVDNVSLLIQYIEYKPVFDFENAQDAAIVTPIDNVTLSVDTYNGSKALKFYAPNGSTPKFHLSAEYLAWAFADEAVQFVSFDISIQCASDGTINTVTLVKQLASAKGIRLGQGIGTTQTVTITRAEYETFLTDTTSKAGICEFRWDNTNIPDRELTWYVDNLMAVSCSEYDFEDGKDPGVVIPKEGSIVSIATYNGSKVLKFYATTHDNGTPKMHISADYLALAFGDEDVQAVSFDVTIECAPDGSKNTVTLWKQLANADKVSIGFTIGETQTITITRAEYEEFAANTSNKAGICEFRWNNTACPDRELTWYVDNVALVRNSD